VTIKVMTSTMMVFLLSMTNIQTKYIKESRLWDGSNL
jgi:hypothetical protein